MKSKPAESQGLGRTLFARLQEKHPDAAHLLEVQYRMHAAIMGWSSESFYDGRLEAAEFFENFVKIFEKISGIC